MALEKLNEDVSVHQTLGDEPNAENSLTSDDLKRLFDKPAELIKKFINDQLVPNAVDKRGDTMSGGLSMVGHKISNIDAPAHDSDAATKKYVDDKIPSSGAQLSEVTVTELYVNGMTLTEGKDYGKAVPANLPKGKLFFVEVVDE